MAKAKLDTLLDRETERSEPVALDGLGVNGQSEEMALLDTTGRQVIVDLLKDGRHVDENSLNENSLEELPLEIGDQVDVSEQDATAMGHVSEEYTADTIRLLEGVEHVRTRPAMYIGDTGPSGLHHLLFEVVDNSIDEVLAGHATEIWVTLNPDKTVTVRDNGRGIPADTNKQTGLSGVELAMTKLNAGGKFGGGGYKVSGGLHGVGLSCVNFLSAWCEAVVEQRGKMYKLRCVQGVPKPKGLKEIGPSDSHGTTITWLADTEIFGDYTYKPEIFESRIRNTCYLNREVTIHFHDKLTGTEPVTYHYQRGIAELVDHLNENKNDTKNEFGPTIYFLKKREDVQVEIALQYNKSYSETVLSFANNVHTKEGGTHLSGFRTALTRVINQYARKSGAIKEKDANLSGDDVREGLTAVISVRLFKPQFEGQTKAKLGNSEVEGIVNSIMGEGLTQFLEENPAVGKKIIDKALTAQRARDAARKAADLIKRQSSLENSNLPGKLADCTERDPKKCELFLVEGDSAGGCFLYSTLLKLADGEYKTIQQLAEDWDKGITHFGYATNEKGDVRVVPLIEPRLTKRQAILVEVLLDNGEKIRCTPDHLFRLHSGSYLAAAALRPAQALMSLPASDDKESADRRVLAVQPIDETGDVYDLTVDKYHNFALASGVFVHNSAKQGRDRRYQAILPLRGKIINTSKAALDKTLENNEVRSLITALGIGIKVDSDGDDEGESTSKFDMSKLRYDRIIIMTDADVDGDHIRTLLLTFFFSYMQPLIEQGHVYIAQPPLYSIKSGKDTRLYARSEEERDRMVKELKRKDVQVGRFKGLGEMNAQELFETTLNIETRSLARVTLEDANAAAEMFSILMSDKVEPRKQFIIKYAREVSNVDWHC